jgi:integrase
VAIVNEAFRDPTWGMLVWLSMTSGARRGELCALRFDRLDLNRAVLSIRTSIAQDGGETWEKGTKTHQQRRITLDQTTVALLGAYLRRCDADAADLGIGLSPRDRLFSSAPDHRHVGQARHRHPAVPPTVRSARLGHAHPPAAALLGHRPDRGRGRRAHRGRPTRPRRRWSHDPARLLGVGVRSRPRSGRQPRSSPARPADRAGSPPRAGRRDARSAPTRDDASTGAPYRQRSATIRTGTPAGPGWAR